MIWLKRIFHRHSWFLTENKTVPLRIMETREIKLITLIHLVCECGEESDKIYIHKTSLEGIAKGLLFNALQTPYSGGNKDVM